MRDARAAASTLHTPRRMHRLIFCAALLTACAGNDDLTGTWTGFWNAGTSSGSLDETLAQSSSDVSGTASFTGSPCWNTADLALVLDGGHLSGTATAGGVAAQLSADVTDSHMTGMFDVPTGLCTGAGSFTLDRH
jgi:hypothetical protein